MRELIVSVAIFILANTDTTFRPQGKHSYQYFENRLKPIHDTWGSYFKYFYYVLGSNKFDYDFLHDERNNCKNMYITTSSHHSSSKHNKIRDSHIINNTNHRKLVARNKQMKYEDVYERYNCQITKESSILRYKKLMLRNNNTDITPFENIINPNPAIAPNPEAIKY